MVSIYSRLSHQKKCKGPNPKNFNADNNSAPEIITVDPPPEFCSNNEADDANNEDESNGLGGLVIANTFSQISNPEQFHAAAQGEVRIGAREGN